MNRTKEHYIITDNKGTKIVVKARDVDSAIKKGKKAFGKDASLLRVISLSDHLQNLQNEEMDKRMKDAKQGQSNRFAWKGD